MIRVISSLLLLLSVSACVVDHHHRGHTVRPEELLDVTSERVTFSLKDSHSLNEIMDWVRKERPSKAELSCGKDHALCKKVEHELKEAHVATKHTVGHHDSKVVLMYEKMVARDCTKKHGHPNYRLGCAVSTNILHMISDYRYMIDPPVSSPADAARSAKYYNHYRDLHY
jgi:hypothetical protein